MGTRDKALRLQRRTSILHFVRRAISQSEAQVAVMHGTSGLVAMTSASHAEGRQFDPGLVYIFDFAFVFAGPSTALPCY